MESVLMESKNNIYMKQAKSDGIVVSINCQRLSVDQLQRYHSEIKKPEKIQASKFMKGDWNSVEAGFQVPCIPLYPSFLRQSSNMQLTTIQITK